MVQTPARIERSANAAELLQIEGARRALRSSARWASALGIYLPAVLALGTIGWTLAVYPGGWPEKVLVCLAESAAMLCVFTLPVMVGSTGRTVLAYRRLRRDAEHAYPIAQARGEVTWGRRDRALVATVDGERLLSPFFTMFSAVPAYWHHFDSLPPGAYSFALLPESRLVLSAQPISAPTEHRSLGSDQARAKEPSAPERALRAAFRNGEADVAANREGRASARQRLRLVGSHWWVFLGNLLLGGLSYQSIRTIGVAPESERIVGCVFLLGVTAFLLVLLGRVVWDALEGRVDSARGTVSLRFGKTDATGRIGTRQFTLGNVKARALQQGHSYRVYWFKHSRVVVAADPADITRP